MKKNAPIYLIIIAAIVFVIIHSMRIDYNDLAWDTNSTPYTGILIAVLILLVGLYRLRK